MRAQDRSTTAGNPAMLPLPLARPSFPDAALMEAARCWRAAKDSGRPVQPAVHAVLAPGGWEMLAPALDSLMRLCEQRFDRALCTGCPLAPSADERMLCRLLADPAELARTAPCRAGGLDRTLGCALASTRIMLSLADGAAITGDQLQ